VLLALGLATLVGNSLYESYEQYRFKLKREMSQKRIESSIRNYLRNQTLTFGANDFVELEKIVFDWPNYWEQNRPPTFQVVVRSIDPTLPSYKQVQQIQDTINHRLSGQYPGLELQMQVQRINVSVVEGNEVEDNVDLEQILNDADAPRAPMKVLEDEPTEELVEVEICSEPDC
tara:strand:- start:76 stop:597 length:522 start_codon:yes stop_codon:yes gene_type:complete